MPNKLLLTNCQLFNSTTNNCADLLIHEGVIEEIDSRIPVSKTANVFDVQGRIVAPGFIDVHIQGAGGADILDGSVDALQTISRTLARFGTTGFLATTVVHRDRANAHLQLAAAYSQTALPGARILGIHLEGPFINPLKRGAIAVTSICPPDRKVLADIYQHTGDALKMMTIAPELEGNVDIIRELIAQGTIASFGHSQATYDETRAGIAAGISHATHLFNAMPSIHHREPGPIPAIMEAEQVTVQLISDGVHLHPAIVRMIYQQIGSKRIVCITDGIQAIGLPAGKYVYNGQEYESRNGEARYLDGTLIGTATSLQQMARRFIQFTGCSLTEAINCASLNPAKLLGIADRKGSIAVGKDADLVVIDDDFTVRATIIDGTIVYEI